MEQSRTSSLWVGFLFIVATVVFMAGQMIYQSLLSVPDYLQAVYAGRTRVAAGILLEFLGVAAIALIPVFALPVLEKQDRVLSIAYIVMRAVEAILLVGSAVAVLTLVEIGGTASEAAGSQAALVQAGDAVKALGESSFSYSVGLIFPLGACIFNWILYRGRLVPRFISVWGLIGAALLFVGSVGFFLQPSGSGPAAVVEAVLVLPIAVNEMVLAFWLIVRGFNESAPVTGVSSP